MNGASSGATGGAVGAAVPGAGAPEEGLVLAREGPPDELGFIEKSLKRLRPILSLAANLL